MGTVKKASKVIIEKYYTKLTLDFDTNKKIIEEIALIPSKPLRNKIAGFVTHLMKRLEKSTVSAFQSNFRRRSERRGTTTCPTSPSWRSPSRSTRRPRISQDARHDQPVWHWYLGCWKTLRTLNIL